MRGKGFGLEEGAQVGRYVLLTRLATGGMAEVWLARATGVSGFQKTVVLKTILPHLADNPDFVRMFINEALLAAVLDHPNIVHIFDLGQIGEGYFIAMEYIAGRTLRQTQRELRKTRRAPPSWFVLHVAASVCDALQYAHAKADDLGRPLHLVHRDITPENIMVAFTGDTKVLDFGIAKASTAATVTRAGMLKGKCAYMAPEQISGASTGSLADPRSDIYALGVVMYEMLTGVRPFRSANEILLLRDILEKEPKLPSEVASWVPKPLEQIVLKAMAKDVNQRYQQAGDLRLAIDRYMVSAGIFPTRRHVAAYVCNMFGEQGFGGSQPGGVTTPVRTPSSGSQNVQSELTWEPVSGEVDGPDSAVSVDISMVLVPDDGPSPSSQQSSEPKAPEPSKTKPKQEPESSEPLEEVSIASVGLRPFDAEDDLPSWGSEMAGPVKSKPAAEAKPPTIVPAKSVAKKAPSKAAPPRRADSGLHPTMQSPGVAPPPRGTSEAKQTSRPRSSATPKPSKTTPKPAHAASKQTPSVKPSAGPKPRAADIPVPHAASTAPGPGPSAKVQFTKPKAGGGEIAVPKPSLKPGSSPQKPSAVSIPKPSAKGEVLVPKPAGKGEVSIPKPAGKGEVSVPKPAGKGELSVPKPAVKADVSIPKPTVKADIPKPAAARGEPDVVLPKPSVRPPSADVPQTSVSKEPPKSRPTADVPSSKPRAEETHGQRKSHVWDAVTRRAQQEKESADREGVDSERGSSRESGVPDEVRPSRATGHDWDAVVGRIRTEMAEVSRIESQAREQGVSRSDSERRPRGDDWTAASTTTEKRRPRKGSMIAVARAGAKFEAGLDCLRKHDYDGALAAWTEALELDPENRLYQGNLRMLRKLIDEGH